MIYSEGIGRWIYLFSHASEDKDEIARPIANDLRNHGFKVWYDEDAIQLGDSIRKKIDQGLSGCRFGLVILSPSFFSKQWTLLELDALTTQETSRGTKVILPIWHNVTRQDVERFSPILAARLGVSTSKGLKTVVQEILAVLTGSIIQPSPLEARLSRPLTGESDLINWCLTRVFEDQFDTGDAKGAWSKKYPEYLAFLYGKSGLPSDISVRDTITFSAWIAIALHNYNKVVSSPNTASLISSKLHLLKGYLVRHYDREIGGFGLTARPKSRSPVGIDVDLRHTCWAMLILWELGFENEGTDEMLKRAGLYVKTRINLMRPEKERAITYAVLHRLLSTEGLSSTVFVSKKQRRENLKRIESILVEKFDVSYGSWDLDFLSAERASIENTLFILYTLPLSSCIDSDCINTLKFAISHICDSRLIRLNGAAALPFYEKGKPDIGASLLLIYILFRDRVFLPTLQEYSGCLIKFVRAEIPGLLITNLHIPGNWHWPCNCLNPVGVTSE